MAATCSCLYNPIRMWPDVNKRWMRTRTQAVLSNGVSNARRLKGNADGKLYVDSTCIDCDTCRWMAPDVFSRDHSVGMSVVHNQPKSAEEAESALKALVSCPTASIRLEKESSGPENELVTTERVKEAMEKFPSPVDAESLAGVYHLGYHSKKSFGATSYLVQTKAHGNIMVDCPRYTKKLAEKIREMGGISLIFLSHKDDVGDHDKWAQEFGATRFIHELEVRSSQKTDKCEVKLSGSGSWKLPGHADGQDESEEAIILFTPGHSSGSITLALRASVDENGGRRASALFTGDHLAYSALLGRLTVFERHNHHSLDLQLQQALDLKQVDFLGSPDATWLLPGHGRRQYFATQEEWASALDELADAFQFVPSPRN